ASSRTTPGDTGPSSSRRLCLPERRPGNRLTCRRHNACRDSTDRSLMVEKSAPATADQVWSAFEAEALPHMDRLFRLAMWFERNRSEAEDLVQETMMQALQSFHRFQPGTNCRAWLTTILQNVRSNRRRARGRSPLVDDPDDRISKVT